MKKRLSLLLMVLAIAMVLVACGDSGKGTTTPTPTPDTATTPDANGGSANGGIDGMTGASNETNLYHNYNKEELKAAISGYKGTCFFTTTNEDGSPRAAIFVPGFAGDDYVFFGWAGNETKTNFLREKRAEFIYYVKDTSLESTDKKRHQGARVVVTLVEDEAVIAELRETIPEASLEYFNISTVCKIEKILPLG